AIKEKALIDAFIKEVAKDGLAAYGYKEVLDALNSNKASLLLVSEGLEWKKIKIKCPNCGREEEKITRDPKEESCSCGGKMKILEEKELADELIELAEQKNIPLEMVSPDTSEGSQFLHGFHGIGAMLRYR
ncbi:MAG: peptide chain release factor 1, partial [Candidatus Micrarchaeota archaeon]